MHRVLIIGAGKIGSLIAFLLANSNDYAVFVADSQEQNPYIRRLGKLPNFTYLRLDAKDDNAVMETIRHHQIEAVVSSLPFYHNAQIAKIAAEAQITYFDLTEDVQTASTVLQLSKQSAATFVPQCGLAPGFVSVVTNHLMKKFPKLDTVKMRVGALPMNISNALQYSLTWSTDGLINEYSNMCQAIENEKIVSVLPLEGLEELKIDGLTYEAFNTSGGIGSLVKSYEHQVKHMSYKTIRYPGHCAKIKFLMNDLRLNEDRDALRHILEHALPKTFQDVVLIFVSVNGIQDDQFIEENYVKKLYPKEINGYTWSAIQLATASEISAVIDITLANPDKYRGFVRQEQFLLEDVINNRFGRYFHRQS